MNHANMNLRRFRPSEREDDNTRLLVGLGYVPILFFLPLIVRPDSKPGRHTANQGLSLLALTILLSIVKAILGVIPIVRVVTNIILIACGRSRFCRRMSTIKTARCPSCPIP